MTLTSRERIMRIFRNEEIDRPALKLWGASLNMQLLHPSYEPVYRTALEKTDLMQSVGSPINLLLGKNEKQYLEVRDVPLNELWFDRHKYYHTPKGTLHEVTRVSNAGEPSYIMEYAVKEPEDIEKLLSIPYEPIPFNPERYHNTVGQIGDRGIAMFSLPHAGYAAQETMGSEMLAILSMDERELLNRYIGVLGGRVREHAQAAIESGIRGVFGWVGPELIIPPLMRYQDFREFVYEVDKPICDDIHNAGGYVWVHCHGRVAQLIDDFADMGVNVLNPLEPPKNGDIILHEAVAKHGRKIGWEGNIEIQKLIQADEEEIREQIRYCAEIGRQVNRFILCPSAGFNEYTQPSVKYISNLMLYMNYGLKCLEC